VGPSQWGTAGLTPLDQNWNEMEILLTESEIWKEEDEVRRSEPLRLSVGRASIGTGLPPRESRIPIYTRRRYISRRFDR